MTASDANFMGPTSNYYQTLLNMASNVDLPVDLPPFDLMVTKFITFSPKSHPHHLHFRLRNSTTG